jgi:MAF protein
MGAVEGGALLLASGSPRRRVMLEAARVPLVVRPVDIEEVPRAGEGPLDFARRMSAEKAGAALAERRPEDPAWVLASDTVVVVDQEALGKPADADEAARMLRRLSGRPHQVVTTWALCSGTERLLGETVTDVHFARLSEVEIADYVASGEPLDKAGAYGVQGLGGRLVDRVEGCFDTVVGLPLGAVLDALRARGIVPPASPVAQRLDVLRGRIAAAAQAAGRPAAEVTLVGVSKRQPLEKLQAALDAGLLDLGENYVQEWQGKAEALGEGPRWHFIGHLQRNKAKGLAGRVHLVHGVHSVALAQALARHAKDAPISILAQVNIGAEDSKSGLPMESLADVLPAIGAVEGVTLRGLMAIPPAGSLGAARRHFAALRALRDGLATEALPLPALSMGMSSDFPAAVAEGATHVRVGSALFGPRI